MGRRGAEEPATEQSPEKRSKPGDDMYNGVIGAVMEVRNFLKFEIKDPEEEIMAAIEEHEALWLRY